MTALLREFGLTALVRLAGILGTLGFGILAARGLGPEAYGVYGTIMAIVAIMTTAAQLGLVQLAVREVGRGLKAPKYAGQAAAAVWWFSCVVCCVAALLCLAAFAVLHVFWPEPQHGFAYVLGFGLVVGVALLNILCACVLAADRVLISQIVGQVARPIGLAFALGAWVLWSGGLQLEMVLIFQLCITAGLVVPAVWATRGYVLEPLAHVPLRPNFKGWCNAAAALWGIEWVRVLDANYALLLLGLLASSYDVGLLRVALSLLVILALPHAILTLSLSPKIVAAHTQGDRNALQRIATQSAWVSFLLACAMLLGAVSLGEPALRFLFGAAFVPAYDVMVLFALGQVIVGWFGVASQFFNLCGHERAYLAISAVALLVSALAFAVLHPTFGLMAAGYAFVLSTFVQGVSCYAVMMRRTGLRLGVIAAKFGRDQP